MKFSKIRVFSWKENFIIFKSLMIHKLSKSLDLGVLRTNNLLNKLINNNIKFKKHNNCLRFQFDINKKHTTFSLKINSSDASVFEQIILENEFFPVIEIVKENNIQVKNILDIGANIGLTSIYFNQFLKNVNFIAIEPSKETCERLKTNIKLNNLSNISIINAGVWNRNCHLKADTNFRDGLDWAFRLQECNADDKATIQAFSIPYIMETNKIEIVDILKIDIEGGEKMLINEQNDLDWLKKVRLITIEIHDELNCRESIENILKSIGFSLKYSGELTIGINQSLIY